MTTANELMERAHTLAESGVKLEEATQDLLARCGDQRVSLVRAKQLMQDRVARDPDNQVATRAEQLLEEALAKHGEGPG